MPLGAVPTVRLRLSFDQVRLIDVGLSDLIAEKTFVHYTGNFRRHFLLPNEYGRFDQRTAPTPAQMATILAAHQKIHAALGRGGRFKLTHDELAACIFGTRHTERLIREKHSKPWKSDQTKAGKRLRSTLERFRKRAKRAFVRELGAEAYQSAHCAWLANLAAVRCHLAPIIKQRKQPRSIRMKAREVIDHAQQLATGGLRLRGFEPPEARFLRSLVRDRLRLAARRGTTRGQMLEDGISASLLLADYIIPRCQNLCPRVSVPPDIVSRPDVQQSSQAFVPPPDKPVKANKIPRKKSRAINWPALNALRAARTRLNLLLVDWSGTSNWSRLNRCERATEVASIARGGVSNREIGRKLGLDEGTIRRLRKEARLPREAWTEIARGKSVNLVMREESDPALQQRKRVERENADRSVSSQLVRDIQEFLAKESAPCDAWMTVGRAKELVKPCRAEWLAGIVPGRPLAETIIAAKPPKSALTDASDVIEFGANWLARWVLKVAPERQIHMTALEQVWRALHPSNQRRRTS